MYNEGKRFYGIDENNRDCPTVSAEEHFERSTQTNTGKEDESNKSESLYRMDVVAVTGSSGLVGRYVVERLIKCGRYKEIRLIDRIQRSCSGSDNVTLRHFCIDINDEGALEQALHGCHAVVHCSHAPLPWTYSDKEASKAIWKDNLSATEMLVDKMVQMGVKSLVHVGDAYSALPIEDNYGLGEMVFNTYPADYILGEYGESRTRGEMYARKATANGSSLKGVFLRPVHVHAEEASSSWRSLMKMAENGSLPYIDGERRGMHQFIYAGNLAAIVDRCLGFLATNPDRVNTEIIYCLDDTYAIPIRQVSEGTLSYPMFRFLFAKTIGFSDRKQRLLLDYIPEGTEKKNGACMLLHIGIWSDASRVFHAVIDEER
ncbi:NAD dependent epimerase/dehydratase family protein [Teladorsagia circumcincta]|uniref:NAD dependent epimerase/dehydratase family protein n=1 Tax=Teladorsagia circumcincta TaxID=45464 RepID=A0A2G9UVI5_TELCI|nr:NAD dependent epimerase/dehydratase family protein [Teladorsagia circumcincta]